MVKLYVIHDSKNNVIDKTFDKYEAEKYENQNDKYGGKYIIHTIEDPICTIR